MFEFWLHSHGYGVLLIRAYVHILKIIPRVGKLQNSSDRKVITEALHPFVAFHRCNNGDSVQLVMSQHVAVHVAEVRMPQPRTSLELHNNAIANVEIH